MKWNETIKKKKYFRILLFEKLIIPFNRFRSLFGLKVENRIPRIIIHERFKNIVKWTTRIFILIGILSSLISISCWYLSLTLAIFLFVVQWFFEKVIFRFTTIFITPLPDFTWDSKEWNGMGYMYTQSLTMPSFFGPAFKTKDFGIKAFNLLLAWNYTSHNDGVGNIYISFVEEDKNTYRVYFFPSQNRKSLIDFEEKIKGENKNKDHHSLVVQMILCQSFPLNSDSNYYKWKELFLAGQPTCLGAFTYDTGSGVTMPIDEIIPIRICKVNFKTRRDLSKKDIEYTHGKYTIGL